jgi:hypothetical protein
MSLQDENVKKVIEVGVSPVAVFRGEECVKLELQFEDGSVIACALSRKHAHTLWSGLQLSGVDGPQL